ncbi:ATP-dependent RecD-like DNA helicase [Geomonas paludis]|uniref:ATP-dependent RecD-like DNA helicase n=1 Tax=Geomonas paludis TaxID=2740185 RepID=A0A6V8MQN5_9BACT|nr:AAA family ATPase [Geomonas paludis]UPU36265.1 ATP-dependent RecD-like DNA helicase [Geomonas paludis]GFO62117.1 ATPase AAA [Geomonas paludis]
MTPWEGIVLVRSERSRDPKGFGGILFGGYHVNELGEKLTKHRIAVNCCSRKLPSKDSVQPWEMWHIKGRAKEVFEDVRDGIKVPTIRVTASDLHMVRHRGDIIVEILMKSKRFTGVGETKARELWSRFGERLYDILDAGCTASLAEVLTPKKAAEVAEGWRAYYDGKVIAFLHKYGFPAKLARKVLDFYGKNAEVYLKDDPYRLLAFLGDWAKTDRLARREFSISEDAEVRLRAAIEEALYRALKDKSTAVRLDTLREKLNNILRVPRNDAATEMLVDNALGVGETNGSYLITPDGLYQAVGPFIMEQTVRDRLKRLLDEPDPEPSMIMSVATDADIDRLISEFEAANHPITLNPEQRQAVFTSAKNRFSIITGGAGTGKTTVLKCLYHVLMGLGYSAVQMALAGKAAKRMREATGGKESHTIAGFLSKADDIIGSHSAHTYYVIDESSMLDIPTIYRIMRRLPDSIRLLMVGDPYQLQPIGPGLVFQLLVGTPRVPQVTLTEIKRQADTTGIPSFAAEIREKRWPTVNAPGVKFIECDDNQIIPQVLGLFTRDPEKTQVICARVATVKTINEACQDAVNDTGKPIRIFGPTGDLSGLRIREGDRIIITENDWERGVMNGDIGTLTAAFDEPEDSPDDDAVVGRALVDGVDQPIYRSDVEWDEERLELGYAITCHKAQGSQFPKVIVPIMNSLNTDGEITCPILDMTWIYTAVTRAEHEVILVGHRPTAEKAVEMGGRWVTRTVGLSI